MPEGLLLHAQQSVNTPHSHRRLFAVACDVAAVAAIRI